MPYLGFSYYFLNVKLNGVASRLTMETFEQFSLPTESQAFSSEGGRRTAVRGDASAEAGVRAETRGRAVSFEGAQGQQPRMWTEIRKQGLPWSSHKERRPTGG